MPPPPTSDRELPGFRVIAPLRDFLRESAAGGFVLVLATALALGWANSPWSDSYSDLWEQTAGFGVGSWRLDLSLKQWVNDGLMVLFFFVVGLEIKRELVEGELNSRRKAALPALAALGGMVVPAVLYSLVNVGGAGSKGWGIPMATDIAMAVGVMTLLGPRVSASLKLFLLAVAIVDDLGAIVVIALFYSEGSNVGYLGAAVVLVLAVVGLRKAGVQHTAVYVVVGFVLWYVVKRSGVHATIAGVVLGLLAPTKPSLQHDLIDEAVLSDVSNLSSAEETVRMARGSVSVVERLEHQLHPWTSLVIVPLFALANAGIALDRVALRDALSSRVTIGVMLGLVVGKVIGISGATWLALRANVGELPTGVTFSMVVAVSSLAGIGFTVSIFVSGLAFGGALESQAKIGILIASLVSALLGTVLILSRGTAAPAVSASARD